MDEKFLANRYQLEKIPLDDLLDLRDLIQNQIIHAIIKDNLNELDQISSKYQYLLFLTQDIMEHAEQQLGNLSNIIFELGVLNELLILSNKIYTSKKLAKALARPRTAYKDQILEILYKEGPLLHKALAEKLKITPSNLSNVIRRLNNEEVPLIEETLAGKYKYYTLNRSGRNYIKEKAKQEIPFIVRITQQPTSKSREFINAFQKSSSNLNLDLKRQIKSYQEKQSLQTTSPERFSYDDFSRGLSTRYKQCGKNVSFTSSLTLSQKPLLKRKEKSPLAI